MSGIQAASVWQKPERRTLVFTRLVCAMILVEMTLCPRLWTSERSFPTLPVMAGMPDLPSALTIGLLIAFVVAVVLVAFRRDPRGAIFSAVGLGAILVLFDVTRFQPWFYEGLLFLLSLTFEHGSRGSSQRVWALCALIMVAIYLWSGFHKFNLMFPGTVFYWLLQPFGLQRFQPLWMVVPTLEIAFSLLLVFPRTRPVGLGGVVAMHGLVLIALGPWGRSYNSAVWPWNLFMPAMAWVLFFRNPDCLVASVGRSVAERFILILVGVMPVLRFCGAWDEYPAWALYSGQPRQAYLILTAQEADRAHSSIRRYIQRGKDRIGIGVTEWAMSDLNVPPYPELRVYRELGKRLRDQGVPVKLLVSDRPNVLTTHSTFHFVPLE